MKNSEKIRVLFLITDLGRSGAERYLVDLCRVLSKHEKFDFIIGSLYPANEYLEETKDFNVCFLDYETFSFTKRNRCDKYLELLQLYKPHIVHTHRFLAEFLSSYYVDPNIKYVCHGHDKMIQLSNFSFKTIFSKQKILDFMEKQVLKYKKYNKVESYFIANSNDTKAYLKKVLPRKLQNNIRFIQLGFNYYRFNNKTTRTIIDKNIKCVNVGSFLPLKNQEFIVEIAKELRHRSISFEINLIGHGERLETVKESIIKNNLERNVFLRGVQNNVEDWYKNSDIYIHTSYSESFGLVFLEAMASGLPIVTLDGKGNRDVIEDGKNGFMIYEQNPILFADRIEQLINNRDLYSEMSEYAKNYAAKFDSEKKTAEIVDFYNSILDKSNNNIN